MSGYLRTAVPGLLFAACCVGSVLAQDYPNRPIRILATQPGSASDFISRLLATEFAATLSQSAIVDNRPGTIAITTAARASPDGYTLLLLGNPIWMAPLMEENVSWDPLRDFAPISLAERSPSVVVVHASVPVKSMQELIALAKAKPGSLNYASGPSGGTAHLAAELFKAMAQVNIVRVPYKTGGTGTMGLVAGEVHLSFVAVTGAAPHIQSGKIRALAATSAQPSALLPGLPTVASAGLPGYEMASITGILAPAKTPAGVISRLNQESVRVLSRNDVKDKFIAIGIEAAPSTPEQFTAFIKTDTARWKKVIKDAGIGSH